MKKYRRIVLFIVISLMFLLLVSCNSDEKVVKNSVKIGYLPITHSLPLYVEKEVERGDIELIKFGSWPELMDALNSGKIDGASVLIELAMKAKSQGIDLKAVALGHSDGNAVIVNEKIKSVKDLKGKNFAIPNKLSTHYILLYEMLKEENMKLEDINIIELPPSEMAVALLEKRIDGYCVAEPFGAKAVVNGNGKVLKQSSEIIPNSICCALVFRGDFIKNRNEKAKEIVKKYSAATEDLSNKGEREIRAKEFLNVQDKVLTESLGWISFEKLRIEESDYNKISDYLKEMKLLDKPPTYDEFVDNSLLE
ncbi:NlpA lipoprotein [Clostridium bornimense]|uniref:NlpA lipoprotein n=1 Tax=Clostridium bornimense TaxID=1216932 RepID=W6RSJ4_9CLOT|nr:ABC transporter substrate-binding protein [Clostridium bornimense]CDM67561.1 NlpA lipoprotein [Clostridium bornimense]